MPNPTNLTQPNIAWKVQPSPLYRQLERRGIIIYISMEHAFLPELGFRTSRRGRTALCRLSRGLYAQLSGQLDGGGPPTVNT